MASTLYLYANFTITAFEEKSTTPNTPIAIPVQNCFFDVIPLKYAPVTI